MYKHIKKEYLFIFLVIFTALVLFTYFEDFNYTGLTTKWICEEKGYQCCTEGEGTNYFSMDYSCPNNKQCWTSCPESVKEVNVITTSAFLDGIWSPIKNFFVRLFSKGPIAGVGTVQCQGKNTLFTISEEVGGDHTSKFIGNQEGAYSTPVCSEKFDISTNQGDYLLIKLSESSGTNSHIQKPGEAGNYPIPIYIKPEQGSQGQIDCLYQLENPGVDYECLFSMDGLTNAHVGACSGTEFPVYNYKVWCKLTPQNEGGRSPPRRVGPEEGFTLNIIIEPDGAGSITKDPDKNRYNNEPVTITARPTTPNYEFSHFVYGNIQRTLNPLIITIDRNREVTVVFNQIGRPSPTIPPLIQSDYEVYWANDGIVAFSFGNYIERNPSQLPNIQKFKVYRKAQSEQQFTLITILEKSTTQGKVIKDYRGITTPAADSYEDNKYDFWDDYPGRLLTDGTLYYYKIVPVNNNGNEITPESQAIIQITSQVTNTALTVSGSCSGITYSQCIQNNPPQYCGIGENLIQNNGFESLQSWSNKSLTESNSRLSIETETSTNSKVAKLEIPAQSSGTQYLGIYQTVNVNPNTYYRLSAKIKASNIGSSKKPYLSVDCYNDSLNDQKRRKFLVKEFTVGNADTKNIINSENFNEYSLMFKTYKGAQKCDIYPVFFDQSGATGTIYIDKVRLEELGSTIPQDNIIRASSPNNDCGICGCPTTAPYCQPNGECIQTNLCGNGAINIPEACDYNSQNPSAPVFPAGKTCETETRSETPPRPNGNLGCTQQCGIDITQCTAQPTQPENCNIPAGDADNDGIKALFDSYCAGTLNNYISLEEIIPSSTEAYTLTDIKIDCKYSILDENEDEKRLSITNEKLAKDCIDAYVHSVDEQPIKCEQKSINTGTNTVSLSRCNVGEISGEIPITCEVNDKCSIYNQNEGNEGIKEELITVNEYSYCSEVNDGFVEFVENNINLNRANEPGEELTIKGKILASEQNTITVNAALIDLANDRMLKETSSDVIYNNPDAQKSFELKLTIPSIVTNTYFVYAKAYIKGHESDSCTQTFKIIDIRSNLEDEGPDFEANCTDLIDDDNDGLRDCNDPDCSDDSNCMQERACTPGERIGCQTDLPGICSLGTQTCSDLRVFNECMPTIQPNQRQETPNGYDDNCNGQIDEGAGSAGADSDNDGLPDFWETQYFRTVSLFNADDDPDDDGISNIDEFRSGSDPNVSDKKKINLTWLWLTLGIIILIVIIFFVIKLLKKPSSSGTTSSYADPRLKAYVNDSLRKGFTKQQIKQALLTKGWSPSDIDKVLR